MNENYEYSQKDCYTYIDGQGFAQTNYRLAERRTLAYFSLSLGWSLLLALMLSGMLPFLFMYIAKLFMPAVRFYNNQVISKKFIFYIAGTAAHFFALTVPFALMAVFNRVPLKVVIPSRKIKPMVLLSAVCVCMGTAVAGAFCAWLVSALLGQAGFTAASPDFPLTTLDTASVIVLLVQVLVVAPLAEEFAFRGVIMGVLRRFGDGFAVIVSAFLFAMFHRNMAQFPNAFLCGMVIGCAVIHTGSIWTGVIMHLVNNLLAVGLTYFQAQQDAKHMVMLMLSLMFLAGVAGIALIAANGRAIWHKREACQCVDEGEKYKFFFTQPVQAVCLAIMLAGIIGSLSRL